MSRKKITIDDLQDDFEKARPLLGKEASLMPLLEDDSKAVLATGDKAEVYTCSALKGHLRFLTRQLG